MSFQFSEPKTRFSDGFIIYSYVKKTFDPAENTKKIFDVRPIYPEKKIFSE